MCANVELARLTALTSGGEVQEDAFRFVWRKVHKPRPFGIALLCSKDWGQANRGAATDFIYTTIYWASLCMFTVHGNRFLSLIDWCVRVILQETLHFRIAKSLFRLSTVLGFRGPFLYRPQSLKQTFPSLLSKRHVPS